jgi:hypothetical protein
MARKSKEFDIIRKILLSIPPALHSKWLSIQDLLSILKRCGCGGVTMPLVVKTIRKMSKTGLPLTNRFNLIGYVCFSGSPAYTSPQEQLKLEPILPRIKHCYFLASGRFTTEDARLIDGSQPQKPKASPNKTTADEQPKASRQGLKLVDMDIEESFIDIIQQHAAECGHSLVKVDSKNVRKGFDLIATYSCKFCKKEIIQWSSRDASRKGSRGVAPSKINLQIAVGCYSCGIHPSKAHKLFTRCGILYVISRLPIVYVVLVLSPNN